MMCLTKLNRVVGYVLLYKKKLLQSCNKGNPTQKEETNRKVHCYKNQLDMVLIQKAEHRIIRAIVKEDISMMRSSSWRGTIV